nr:AraC family transcriptional regulator [Ancylobacter koreensis]
MRSGLGVGEYVPSSQVAPGLSDLLRAREHGYRRVDAHTLLHLMNFEIDGAYALALTRPDLVCMQAIVAGSYDRWIGPRMDLVPPQILQISNAPRSTAHTQAGHRLRGVLVICEREHLLRHYGLNLATVPELYRPIFLSREGSPEVLQLPLPASALGLVDQMLACKYPEPLRGIFLGVKTVEFICEVAAQLHRPQRPAAPRALAGHAKRHAVEAAAEIYRREFADPPSIEQLALRVGLNRNELTAGFRSAYGLTPHAYAQMLRMERARELLGEGSLSISEVARRVGYEGYSSFARAFHGHFGRPPALARKAAPEPADE